MAVQSEVAGGGEEEEDPEGDASVVEDEKDDGGRHGKEGDDESLGDLLSTGMIRDRVAKEPRTGLVILDDNNGTSHPRHRNDERKMDVRTSEIVATSRDRRCRRMTLLQLPRRSQIQEIEKKKRRRRKKKTKMRNRGVSSSSEMKESRVGRKKIEIG